MRVVPGDILTATQGWSLSKLNYNMAALASSKVGNDLIVIAVEERESEGMSQACVLSPVFGPLWIHLDSRNIIVNRAK